ncbi:MAG: hypothetical protein ACRDJN_04310 [Chloroflexota bacterium]
MKKPVAHALIALLTAVLCTLPATAVLAGPLPQEPPPPETLPQESAPEETPPQEAAPPATPAAPSGNTLPIGTVVALAGTPHIWIADARGRLHWAGDTAALALANSPVVWESRREVTLDQLRTLPLGDPWLSAGLLKIGEPIYLVKWETGERLPRLLHIQSIDDVELFGSNAQNYGYLLFERPEWEEVAKISVDRLRRGVLPSIVSGRAPLAGLLSPEELTTFSQSALTGVPGAKIVKWMDTISVEVRGNPGAQDQATLDAALAELRELLAPLEIRRVPSDGNLIVHLVPAAQASSATEGAVSAADGAAKLDAVRGALTRCVTAIDTDATQDVRNLLVRHGLAHCLGLGHSNRADSVLNANLAHQPGQSGAAGQTSVSSYFPIDRTLIRTLYHANVVPDMDREQVVELFG